MFKLLSKFLFGVPETQEEKDLRLRAKACMLGASARLKPDEDGTVKIRDSKDEDREVCSDNRV